MLVIVWVRGVDLCGAITSSLWIQLQSLGRTRLAHGCTWSESSSEELERNRLRWSGDVVEAVRLVLVAAESWRLHDS